jgi:hypothetical protein
MNYAALFFHSSYTPTYMANIIYLFSGGLGAWGGKKETNVAGCCWYNRKAWTEEDHDVAPMG